MGSNNYDHKPTGKPVTYIKVTRYESEMAVGLAYLEKTGRLYYHLLYAFPDQETWEVKASGWLDQVKMDEVKLLDGHQVDLVRQFRKWRSDWQDYRHERDQHEREVSWQIEQEKRQKVAEATKAWESEHPRPVRPGFLQDTLEG